VTALGRLTWSAWQFLLCDFDFNIFMTLRCQAVRHVLQKASRGVSGSGGRAASIIKWFFFEYLA
jgi:hypothetical protein